MVKQSAYWLDGGGLIYDDYGKYKLHEVIYYGHSDYIGRTRKGRRIGRRSCLYKARVIGITA